MTSLLTYSDLDVLHKVVQQLEDLKTNNPIYKIRFRDPSYHRISKRSFFILTIKFKDPESGEVCTLESRMDRELFEDGHYKIDPEFMWQIDNAIRSHNAEKYPD